MIQRFCDVCGEKAAELPLTISVSTKPKPGGSQKSPERPNEVDVKFTRGFGSPLHGFGSQFDLCPKCRLRLLSHLLERESVQSAKDALEVPDHGSEGNNSGLSQTIALLRTFKAQLDEIIGKLTRVGP